MIELDPVDYKCRQNEDVKPANQRPFGISPLTSAPRFAAR
jgi:hypothetical protein